MRGSARDLMGRFQVATTEQCREANTEQCRVANTEQCRVTTQEKSA